MKYLTEIIIIVPLATPPPPHQWKRAGALKLKSFKIIHGIGYELLVKHHSHHLLGYTNVICPLIG